MEIIKYIDDVYVFLEEIINDMGNPKTILESTASCKILLHIIKKRVARLTAGTCAIPTSYPEDRALTNLGIAYDENDEMYVVFKFKDGQQFKLHEKYLQNLLEYNKTIGKA
jgi:hypothetical protein